MKTLIYSVLLLISLVAFDACTEDKSTTVELWGGQIKLNGSPEPELIKKLERGDIDFVFSFSDVMTLSIIIESPYIYHCFILEQILDNKQLNYLKIDDASRFHYVPKYDSLSYDLSLSCADINKGLLPSSKLDSVLLSRAKSDTCCELLSLCDDDKEFTDYFNKSLYFNSDSSVIEEYYKQDRLFRLMEILLVRLVVSPVFDDYPIMESVFIDADMFLCGGPTACFYTDRAPGNPVELLEDHLIKWNEGYNLDSFVSMHDGKRYATKNYSFYKCLKDNLGTKINEIDSLYKAGWYIYNYHNCYFFAFSVNRSADSVLIERKVINPEYFVPSRFNLE